MYIPRSLIHRAEYPPHQYSPFVSLTFRAEYPTFVNHMITNTVSNTQGNLPAHYTCIYLVLLSIAPNIHLTEYSPFV